MGSIVICDTEIDELRETLVEDGYRVTDLSSGQAVLWQIKDKKPYLFCLGVNLPDMSGIELCRQLRERNEFQETPILLFGEQRVPETVAAALDAGGTDFICKPFAPREVSARVRAHLRRSRSAGASSDEPDVLVLPAARRVLINQREVQLTRVEYRLMDYLCRQVGSWHSIRDLLSDVWQYPDGTGNRALVRNHVRNLRRKLEPDTSFPRIIFSRHGRGYKIKAQIDFG